MEERPWPHGARALLNEAHANFVPISNANSNSATRAQP